MLRMRERERCGGAFFSLRLCVCVCVSFRCRARVFFSFYEALTSFFLSFFLVTTQRKEIKKRLTRTK